MSDEMKGVFLKYLWRDEKSGESLFIIRTKRRFPLAEMYSREETINGSRWFHVTCSAKIPYYVLNTPLSISGKFLNKTHDSRYRTWVYEADDVIECSIDQNTNREYLVSLGFKEDKAGKIASAVGERDLFMSFEAEEATDFLDKTGLTPEEYKKLRSLIRKTTKERELFMWLAKFGIPYALCNKAIKKFGERARERIMEDPYYAGKQLGYSFWVADAIAASLGISPFSVSRMNDLFLTGVDRMINGGSDYLATDSFYNAVIKISKNGSYIEGIPTAMCIGGLTESVVKIEVSGHEVVCSAELFHAEQRIAGNLQKFANNAKEEKFKEEYIDFAEKKCNMKYGGQQKDAFRKLLHKKGLKILTGGPGTGKTTTLKGIIYAYMKMHPKDKIKLCAPTGRAAQRMAESTGMEATTVHRLLEYTPYGETATHKDASDPIDADLIVIDETSMLDIFLFDMLLEAMKPGTSMIMMGDTNQLEPVGPGAILRDLLSLPFVDKANLTEVFRQKGDSTIVTNSIRIQDGNPDLILAPDFEIIRTHSEEETRDKVIELMEKHYDREHPFKTQILCPQRKGEAGIEGLNTVLQEKLNPGNTELRYGSTLFRPGDKVIMIRNNYELDYYNGDVGTVKSVSGGKLIVEIRDLIVEITRDVMEDVRLAYGMTIHKSQGSEFENVIISLPKSAGGMLVKNLFYTGVTRAKKRIWIIDENFSMEESIKNSGVRRRTLMNDILNDNVRKRA